MMGTLSIVDRALDRGAEGFRPCTLLELGTGDGSMMLRLAQRRSPRWPDLRVTLLDRLGVVAPETIAGLRAVGWTPSVAVTDVFGWLEEPVDTRWDIAFANLFMHHFSSSELGKLLPGIAARCRLFLCCEPRRSALPLAASCLIGLTGAGPVTRKDAVASVHAGFRGTELSDLWPDPGDWALHEYSAGLFSHCFLAVRREP
jgi:hypothetical protein